MGALPEQSAEFGFGAGLSQKEDSWLSSSGFGTLHNCVQNKTGALEKHPGYEPNGVHFRNGDVNFAGSGVLMDLPGNTISGSPKLIKRGKQIAAVAGGLLLSKADEWVLQGRVSPWVCEQRTICESTGARLDCCCSGNWAYTAHETATGIRVVAVYLPSGETTEIFVGNNVPSAVTEPRIVAVNNAGAAVLTYMNGTQGKYHIVTPDGIGAPHNLTLTTGYDIVGDASAGQVWTIYITSAGSLVTSDSYLFLTTLLVPHASSGGLAVTLATFCTLCVDVATNRLALCWVEYIPPIGGIYFMSVRVMSFSNDYATTLFAATTVWQEATASPLAAGHVLNNLGIAYSPFDGYFAVFTDPQLLQVTGRWVRLNGAIEGSLVSTAGNVTAPLTYLRSRPAWDAVGQWMFFLADGGLATTPALGRRCHFVLGIEPRSSAGKASPLPQRFGVFGAFSYLTAGAYIRTGVPSSSRISRPFLDGNGVWHIQSLEIGGEGATLQLVRDYALMADDRVGGFAELGEATYITGAVLSQWDGARVCEAGFFFDPNAPTVFNSAGGSMPLGSYVYATTYGRLTSSGEVVRSRPSLTTTIAVVSGGTQEVVATEMMPGPSNIQQHEFGTVVFVEFWRSEVNTTSPLYLAGRSFVDLTTAADVTFTDGAASYAGGEQLYSDGTNGEIANTPPASPLSLCQWRNRLWMTDGEQVYYTKEAADVRGAEWSQAFFVISRGAPGRLSAVVPLGETLMALSDDASAYIYGDAPGADGSGSTLVGPMPVITELGCTQSAGIAQLPDGLLVPTRRGLQFLDGKREFTYIGAAVEDTLAAFPRVRCARLIGGTNRVWISLATEDLSAGIALIYDTFHKTFSTVFSSTEMAGLNMVHCSSIEANGAHSFAVNDGNVYDQTPTSYLMNASSYGQQIETPWFKANGPSGEMRARRFLALMANLSAGSSNLRIEIGYDYVSTYHYSILISNTELVAMEGAPDTLQPRIPFPRQRCQSYRMRFTEVPGAFGPTANSGGFRFVSLRMTTSLRPGSGKLLNKANSLAAFTKS